MKFLECWEINSHVQTVCTRPSLLYQSGAYELLTLHETRPQKNGRVKKWYGHSRTGLTASHELASHCSNCFNFSYKCYLFDTGNTDSSEAAGRQEETQSCAENVKHFGRKKERNRSRVFRCFNEEHN